MPSWTIIEGTWRQWKSPALSWWGRITGDEWDEINGSREKLLGLLRLKYGWTREQAQKEVDTRFREFDLAPE